MVIFLVGIQGGSCAEYACSPNIGLAVRKANEFCQQAHGNKNACEALNIENNVCGFLKDTNECLPLGHGIHTFIIAHRDECNALDKQVCQGKTTCEWRSKDSNTMKFGDYIKSWP